MQGLFLRCSGQELTRHIADEIEFLTSRAWLLAPTYCHDEKEGLIRFILERAPLKRLRRRFLGVVEAPSHDDTRTVSTSVTIRRVKDVAVSCFEFVSGSKERFHIERGVLVSSNRLSVESVEESRGAKSFSLVATLEVLDIELCDIDT